MIKSLVKMALIYCGVCAAYYAEMRMDTYQAACYIIFGASVQILWDYLKGGKK